MTGKFNNFQLTLCFLLLYLACVISSMENYFCKTNGATGFSSTYLIFIVQIHYLVTQSHLVAWSGFSIVGQFFIRNSCNTYQPIPNFSRFVHAFSQPRRLEHCTIKQKVTTWDNSCSGSYILTLRFLICKYIFFSSYILRCLMRCIRMYTQYIEIAISSSFGCRKPFPQLPSLA